MAFLFLSLDYFHELVHGIAPQRVVLVQLKLCRLVTLLLQKMFV